MSKAFDRINHKRLIRKLSNSGIGGNLLNWFESYLTDRRQRVTVLGVTSSTLPVTSGVPQGSILGPALFLLYVNDLPEADLSSRVAMFADDTKLFSAITSQEDVASLQADLVNLEHWSSQSGLSFNQSKCKHQTITRKIVPLTSSYKLEDTKSNYHRLRKRSWRMGVFQSYVEKTSVQPDVKSEQVPWLHQKKHQIREKY
jgi:hypothetical protein